MEFRKENTQVEVLPVVDLCKEIGKMFFFLFFVFVGGATQVHRSACAAVPPLLVVDVCSDTPRSQQLYLLMAENCAFLLIVCFKPDAPRQYLFYAPAGIFNVLDAFGLEILQLYP